MTTKPPAQIVREWLDEQDKEWWEDVKTDQLISIARQLLDACSGFNEHCIKPTCKCFACEALDACVKIIEGEK